MADERRYIAAHNGLRGIAALLVIFYHLQFGADYRLGFETATNFFEQSYLMVDLFFILSGFIISFTARPDGRTMTRQECRKFYRMRVARIFPLHVFCLLYLSVFFAAFAAYLTWQGQPLDQDRWGPMGAFSFLRELLLLHAWGGEHSPTWNIPSWSISAEFLAYLSFPILVALLLFRGIDMVLALLAVGFFCYIGSTTGDLDIISGLSGMRCLAGFIIGMLVFKYRGLMASLSDAQLTIIQMLSAVWAVIVLAADLNDALVIPAFTLFVASTWGDNGLLARLLSASGFQFLGKISYSIYLNHFCLIQILSFFWSRLSPALLLDPWIIRIIWIALVVTMTLAVSIATFQWVEQPTRRYLMKQR